MLKAIFDSSNNFESTPARFNSPHKSNAKRLSLRREIINLSSVVATELNVEENINDDEREKRDRRRSVLMGAHRSSMNSPAQSNATATSSCDSAPANPLAGLSSKQRTEHYDNCIRLAAENKINQKNAFSLHLIDYVNGLVDRGEVSSFQMASSSLDAGAKIYAGRVDAVHQDTFKVLAGLGRSGPSKKQDENMEEEAEVQAENSDNENELNLKQRRREAANRKRRVKACLLTQSTLSKIRLNPSALKYDVDPMFQKQAAAYDEGHSDQLRLNQTRILFDDCELLLDSEVRVLSNQKSTLLPEKEEHNICISDTLRQIMSSVSKAQLPVCEPFHDFIFSDDTSGPIQFPNQNDSSLMYNPKIAEDLDQLRNDEECNDQGAFSDMDMPPDEDNNDSDGDGVRLIDTSVHIPANDLGQAVLVQNAVNSMIQDSSNFVNSLRALLNEQMKDNGSESHGNLLGMWAGPEHWKRKAKLSCTGHPSATIISLPDNCIEATMNRKILAGKSKSSRLSKRKDSTKREQRVVLLDHSELQSNSSWEAAYMKKRASTILSNAAVERHLKRSNLLPPQLEHGEEVFATRNLLTLLNKEDALLHRGLLINGLDVGQDLADYDFGNQVDKEDFCPAQTVAQDEHDPAADSDDFANDDLLPMEGSMLLDEDNPFNGAFKFTQPPNSQSTDPLIEGAALLNAPRQITKIDIGYARAAKCINVKALKSVMWGLLCHDSEMKLPDPRRVDMDMPMSTESYFAHMLHRVPANLGRQMASDLSVPIAFTCLLHLANEKSLFLESLENFSDIRIEQGIPASEVKMAAQYGQKRRSDVALLANRASGLKRKQTTLDDWRGAVSHQLEVLSHEDELAQLPHGRRDTIDIVTTPDGDQLRTTDLRRRKPTSVNKRRSSGKQPRGYGKLKGKKRVVQCSDSSGAESSDEAAVLSSDSD